MHREVRPTWSFSTSTNRLMWYPSPRPVPPPRPKRFQSSAACPVLDKGGPRWNTEDPIRRPIDPECLDRREGRPPDAPPLGQAFGTRTPRVHVSHTTTLLRLGSTSAIRSPIHRARFSLVGFSESGYPEQVVVKLSMQWLPGTFGIAEVLDPTCLLQPAPRCVPETQRTSAHEAGSTCGQAGHSEDGELLRRWRP